MKYRFVVGVPVCRSIAKYLVALRGFLNTIHLDTSRGFFKASPVARVYAAFLKGSVHRQVFIVGWQFTPDLIEGSQSLHLY